MHDVLVTIPLLADATNTPLVTLVVIVGILLVVLTLVAYLILFERWVAALVQDRVGPNRAGPFGLLQPLADVFKLFIKEDFTPGWVEKPLFFLAPILTIMPAIAGLAVLPLGGIVQVGDTTIDLQIARLDIGVIFLLITGAAGVYGLTIGGWASNSKFGVLGGLRSAAQLLSYEVPAGLVIVSMVLLSGSLRLEEFIARQDGLWLGFLPRWFIFTQPLAFVIFMICLLAECNRLPFDLPEAEQELVGGFHTEFSSMKFGLFFLAEFTNVVVGAALATMLFLGGWTFWGLSGDPVASGQTAWYFGLARMAASFVKMCLVILFMMQLRWTLPRFRFDQLAKLAWQVLVPATMLLLLVNATLLWLATPAWGYTIGNVLVAAVVVLAAVRMNGPVTGRQRALTQASE